MKGANELQRSVYFEERRARSCVRKWTGGGKTAEEKQPEDKKGGGAKQTE